MLAIGLHFGCFSIRIGQCFRSRSTGSLQFKPLTRSSYGVDELWAIYQGTLPNAYDPLSGFIGYEALKQRGLDNCSKLDRLFFQNLLQDQTEAVNAWNRLMKSLRTEYIRQNEPINLGLFLEDANFSPPENPRMPWLSGPDRIRELEAKLLVLSKPYHLTHVEILRERQAIELFVANNFFFKRGDILALIEGERTSCWLIEEQSFGKILPLTSAPGLQDLMKNISRDHSISLADFISCFHHKDCLDESPNKDGINAWIQQRLVPALVLAWREIPDPELRKASRYLRIGGEGAYLVPSAKREERAEVSILDNPWYIQAYSASATALDEFHQ